VFANSLELSAKRNRSLFQKLYLSLSLLRLGFRSVYDILAGFSYFGEFCANGILLRIYFGEFLARLRNALFKCCMRNLFERSGSTGSCCDEIHRVGNFFAQSDKIVHAGQLGGVIRKVL
jgi:hypothetical protein